MMARDIRVQPVGNEGTREIVSYLVPSAFGTHDRLRAVVLNPGISLATFHATPPHRQGELIAREWNQVPGEQVDAYYERVRASMMAVWSLGMWA